MPSESASGVQHFGFIPLPGFALMSYAAAVEPLRAANLLAGRPLYRWTNYIVSGDETLSSSGASVHGERLPVDRGSLHTVFVTAGGEPKDWMVRPVIGCLRRLARQGVRIGGIAGGPYLMAAAGLLADRRFTIHWEHVEALVEAFPTLKPERSRFILDRDRLTCGGGIAPMDMMHALITERMGEAFARRVSDWFLHTHVDMPSAPQRASLAERYSVHHPVLLAILEKMETTLSAPLDRVAMASFAGISPRHLDRLFQTRLRTSFLHHYHQLRLGHARNLLRQSALSVTEIGFACGFASSSHFARCYRAQFGITPSAERSRAR
jgi:transcriptional regulator GlxA family with amidase domain